ncbi:MAG: hypothetical protein ACOH5I_17160 [Oligoflexus sp.]
MNQDAKPDRSAKFERDQQKDVNQEEVLPKLRLVAAIKETPKFRSQLASQLHDWANQLDAEIERIKKT